MIETPALEHLDGHKAFAPLRERQAEALACINQLHEELAACHIANGQLKADLNRAKDRCALLDEERRRYRAEALTFRSKLIELATLQSQIGLMTTSAAAILQTVYDLTQRAETPDNATLTEMEHALTPIPDNGYPEPSTDQPAPLEALSPRPRVDSE